MVPNIQYNCIQQKYVNIPALITIMRFVCHHGDKMHKFLLLFTNINTYVHHEWSSYCDSATNH